MCTPAIAIATMVASTAINTMAAHKGAKAQQAYYQAQSQSAEYQSEVAENNAEIARWQASDARDRGRIHATDHRRKVQQLIGRQTAVMAGSGFALDGDAGDIIGGTAEIGEKEASRITANAEREAFRHEQDAMNAEAQSGLLHASSGTYASMGGEVSPFLASGSALFGGASSVASKWYRYNNGLG